MSDAVVDELVVRGLCATCTNLDSLRRRLRSGAPMTAYCGFDPTADSMHVGHLLGLAVLRLWSRHGHVPMPLIGGATGMIGDPSGRSAERVLLDMEQLDANRVALSEQMRSLLAIDGHDLVIVDNRSWFEQMGTMTFLRDVGKLMPVTDMLARDSVKNRLTQGGLSFTEFAYQAMQAYDFAYLRREHDCEMQLGGNDQYGNITAGTDMIRRLGLGAAWGLVWPLMTKSDGEKFGKTASGAVWLSAERTSPYAFHQFWLNVADADVGGLLTKFTLMGLDEIAEIMRAHEEAPGKRAAQRALADDVTAWVHGDEAVAAARDAAEALFGGKLTPDTLSQVAWAIPTVEIPRARLADTALDRLAVDAQLFGSASEARRAVERGGLYVGDARATGVEPVAESGPGYVLLRRGARRHALVLVSD